MKFSSYIKSRIRGTLYLPKLIKEGLSVGKNFNAMEGVIIDPWHCWLIEIGDNVTLAPRVHILAHDASMKKHIEYAKIGKVVIGNNVFIGAGTIVLPNVHIADNTIVGAGSVVSKSIESGVYVGNPCKKIFDYDEWIEQVKSDINNSPVFNETYKIDAITDEKKSKMKMKLEKTRGYIV